MYNVPLNCMFTFFIDAFISCCASATGIVYFLKSNFFMSHSMKPMRKFHSIHNNVVRCLKILLFTPLSRSSFIIKRIDKHLKCFDTKGSHDLWKFTQCSNKNVNSKSSVWIYEKTKEREREKIQKLSIYRMLCTCSFAQDKIKTHWNHNPWVFLLSVDNFTLNLFVSVFFPSFSLFILDKHKKVTLTLSVFLYHLMLMEKCFFAFECLF